MLVFFNQSKSPTVKEMSFSAANDANLGKVIPNTKIGTFIPALRNSIASSKIATHSP